MFYHTGQQSTRKSMQMIQNALVGELLGTVINEELLNIFGGELLFSLLSIMS
jgi:hypothetical protein